MRSVTRLLVSLLFILPIAVDAQRDVVVGVVADGPAAPERSAVSLASIGTEVAGLVGDEFNVLFPDDKRSDGGWTLDGVRAAVREQLDDPEVDIILTTGLVAGSELAQTDALTKPAVVAVVADSELQAFPYVGDEVSAVSGKDNLVYVSDFNTIDDEIRSFHTAIGFEHLAVLIDALTLEAIPVLARDKADQLSAELDVRITIVSVTDSPDQALDRLPNDADAVYVTPLMRITGEGMNTLAAGLIERRLPSLSLIGFAEVVNYGLLMATGGQEADRIRLTRRIALNIQRILRGENAGTLDVVFQESQRRIINMQTAEAIGFVPAYAVLTDAVQIPEVPIESGDPLSLADAMVEALEANLSLRTVSYDPLVAQAAADGVRAALRPQLGIALQQTAIDADRANPLFQSERTRQAQLSGSQLIYSDDVRANLRAAEQSVLAAGLQYQTAELDTAQSAARAYLTVLRARALEVVQRQNLEVTRENLALARIRERIGFSGRGDRLRWESQLATDLQNVIAAEADRRSALVALNQILNRPQNQDFTAPQADVAGSIAIFDDPRFQVFIDNAVAWETFQNYSVSAAIDASPELGGLDELINGQERLLLATKRKRWLPELVLGGTRGSILSRGGAGSNLDGLNIDDESWSLQVSAQLPVLTSGALRARIDSADYQLRQLQQTRAALAVQIEARTRLALQRASGSYPAIEPAINAAAAATENLQLVTDAYSQGAASVTDLIDAQRAANVANLRVEDTRYAALIDIIDVFRSTADFSIFLDSGSTEAWFQKVETYFREQGSDPSR